MKKNNDTKDYSEQLEFLNSEPYYASKKIVNHAVVRFSGTRYRLVPSQKALPVPKGHVHHCMGTVKGTHVTAQKSK